MIIKQVAQMAMAMLGVAACAAPDPGEDSAGDAIAQTTATAAKVPATKITIKSTQPLALVAYREVNDPAWHLATEKTSGSFVAQVRGPYWLTTVCEAAQPGTSARFIQVWRTARTLDDAHDVVPAFVCVAPTPKPLPEVTGVMAQAGTVALGNGTAATQQIGTAPAFPFSLAVPKGTYTLWGFDDDRIAIRHDLAVTRSQSVPALDLAVEGVQFSYAALDLIDAAPDAYLHAVTRIEDPASKALTGDLPIDIADVPLPARIVPSEVMTTDSQTVSAQAELFSIHDNVWRWEIQASRRPWRLGDDPTFVEPAQIGGASWQLDGEGQLVAQWQTLPALTVFTAEAYGYSTAGDWVDDYTELSPRFLATTGATRATVDAAIPGFDAGWVIDYSDYTRNLYAQDVTDLDHPEQAPIYSSEVIEAVYPPALRRARVEPAQSHLTRLPGMPYRP